MPSPRIRRRIAYRTRLKAVERRDPWRRVFRVMWEAFRPSTLAVTPRLLDMGAGARTMVWGGNAKDAA